MQSPHHHEDDDHRASRRVRELYRYFQPEQPPQPTPAQSVSSYFDSWVSDTASWGEEASVPAISTESASTPIPTPSVNTAASTSAVVSQEEREGLVLGNPNRTLNAFAQLAALRLNVQRVLISVSDREQQFIIAESTQTSHPDAATAEEGGFTNDGIWVGCSKVSHAWSMCKNTLAKATVSLPPSARQPPKYRFLVVDDLSKDDRYKSLPFVQGDPQFRFYAGTPLTTETNINIGCFFVLDTKPRDGLNAAERETMGFLGMLVMDYLKISRQAHEGRRATRLSRGLSCFVEGGSGFEDPSHPSYMGSPSLRSSTPVSANGCTNNLTAGSLKSGLSRRSNSSDTRSLSSVSDSKPGHISRPCTPPPEPNSRKSTPPLDETHDTSWPFKRAANLLRQSLELEGDGGVIFMEAGNNPVLDAESGSDDAGETGNPAPVLAVSTEEEPFAPEPGSKVTYPATNLDRGFLLRLSRRYGKGRLWGFHRDGMLSSSEDDEVDEPRQSRYHAQTKGKGKWKATENKLLNLYFPNACQVLFVPLWNAANSQYFAGCFCWNTVETRVFSPSVEMSSVLGFSSSIMAEYSRIQSLISDRQKSDFIGSISHELRSPLHGVLAAAEFLQGTQLGEFQGSLLDTINACGRTLLDTMNQVLDFSKIVSLERTWRHIKRHKASPMEVQGMEKVHLDTYVTTDLGILAEEVVEGVCLGHAYGQRATAAVDQPVLLPHTTARDRVPGDKSDPNTHTEVEVMMDIGHNDWVYRTQPGALRRILMNVLGNAMKYTDFGRISVRLEVTEASEGRSQPVNEDLVTLTVTDTGKGISEDFMRGQLYTPFAQEDSLAVGTGLGMSIVRSLVKSLHGSVHTYSRPGEGTMVKVALPLERPQPQDGGNQSNQDEKDTLSQARMLRDNFAGRRVAILGVDSVNAAQHPLWDIVSRYVTEWYGLELVSWPPTTPTDLVLADEQILSTECKNGFSPKVPALVVLCNKSVDYGTAQSTWSHLAQTVEMIRQPSGPHKLARCIRKCLESVPAVPASEPAKPLSIALPERLKPDTLSSDLSGVGAELTPELTTSSGASSRSPGSEIEPPEPFDSAPTASFQLPLAPSPPQKPDQEQKPLPTDTSPTTTTTAGESPRVLVVDDNSINLNLMLMFLKKRKLVTLDAAENGLVAVSSVEKIHGYDLIFLDMSMPVMDGFEAARTIRSMEKEYSADSFRRATIIALTGLSSPGDESEALASGVDVFLTKPVSFKDVARLLDEWEKRSMSMSMSMSIGA